MRVRAVALIVMLVLAVVAPATVALPAQAAAPGEPTDVRATPNGNGVYVTFQLVPDATSYEVWRDGRLLGTTDTRQFSDDSTTRGQHYGYDVRSVSPDGYSEFVHADLTQWTDDGSRTWLASGRGPAECARTGDSDAPRVICTVQTSAGWKIFKIGKDVAWGEAQNRAWFTVNDKIDYCNLLRARTGSTRVSCLELGKHGWGTQSRSGTVDWGDADGRTWTPTRYGPALCARTETGVGHGLVCTVRTKRGWKSYRTHRAIDWGNAENRTWLVVEGKVSYCATVGTVPDPRVACVSLGRRGWGAQSVSPVTDWGESVERTWVASRYGPALCSRTTVDTSRRVVCTVRTTKGWQTYLPDVTVSWTYQFYRAWITVGGKINFCGLVGDIPDNLRVSCLELGKKGWGQESISPITDWGDPTNRTWMPSRYGPALCGRSGEQPDGRVVCTVRTSQGWTLFRSPSAVDWGYEAERSWVTARGKISFCDQVGDYSVDQHAACLELGAHGWGQQIISPRTDWGDNQP